MTPYQLNHLQHFYRNERAMDGELVDWAGYDFMTMQELDRLRAEIGSPCVLIRGGHGYLKETAVDAAFPHALFASVVMACMRSGFSKGFYEGGSIHLDNRMGPNGLARCWIAFKPETHKRLEAEGFGTLRQYAADGWEYYQWSHARSWELLNILIQINDRDKPVFV